MTNAIVSPYRTSLPIIATITLAFRIFWRAPRRFLGLMAIEIVALALISAAFDGLGAMSQAPGDKAWLLRVADSVLECVVQIVIQGSVILAAYTILSGGSWAFWGAVSSSFRRSGAMLAVSLLQVVIIGLGAILFVVPGIIAAVMLCVGIPVCLLEGRRATRSLDRSLQLTKGNRMRILTTWLLVLLILATTTAIGAVVFRIGGPIPTVVFAIVAFVALVPPLAIFPAALYAQLRAIVEQGEPVFLAPSR